MTGDIVGTRVWRVTTTLTRPLSLNDRQHWAAKARRSRRVRDAVALHARSLRIPELEHVHVRLVYEPATNRRRDPDNLWATAKPAVDGLVDAGVVPDDTAQFVTRWDPLITPKRVEPGCRVWLDVWA